MTATVMVPALVSISTVVPVVPVPGSVRVGPRIDTGAVGRAAARVSLTRSGRVTRLSATAH
ncbi:hypothetical protein R1X32_04285 (plasmid) [Rhodococcus opacus]|uniref:hypothetical protein n=1 Tax=Rhodococcus opacus TaxID=37919 RepID=UPI0034D18246